MLPEGWHLSTLGEIARITSGGTPSRAEPRFWNGSIPWVTTSEVQFNTILDTSERITEAGLANSSAKLFPENTLLMAMYGQGKTRGKVAKLGIEATTNQACAAILLHPPHDPDFYFQYLTSQYESLRELGNASTQMNLSGSILKDLPVPVPPLHEQREIARALEVLDRGIAVSERLLLNSQGRQASLAATLLASEEDPLRLGDVATFKNGLNFNASDNGEAIRIVGVSDFKRHARLETTDSLKTIRVSNRIRDDELLASGDLLFVRSNGNKMLVGRCLHFPNVTERLAFSGFTIRARVDSKVLHPSFAAHLMRSQEVREQILLAGGGTSISNLSQQALADITIRIPSLAAQRHIAHVLDKCERQIVVSERLLANSRQQKQVVMEELLTGARRVQTCG
jgi:type I restriction enzyme S subunit